MRFRPPIFILPLLLIGCLLLDRCDGERRFDAARERAQDETRAIGTVYDEGSRIPQVTSFAMRAAVQPGPTAIQVEVISERSSPTAAILDFELTRPGFTRVLVLDDHGNRVTELVEVLNAGAHECGWDGRAEDGSRMAPGAYFAWIQSRGQIVRESFELAASEGR